MDSSSNPISRVTILSSSGISIYHQSFGDTDNFDEHLFSGFTSAILSFTKEIGNELSSISMKGLDLYFQQHGNLIVVLGVDSTYNNQEMINSIFDDFENNPQVQQMLENVDNGYLEVPDSFEQQVIKILSRTNSKIQPSPSHPAEDEDISISGQIKSYLEGKIDAKSCALELIGEDISSDEASKKLESSQMILDLLNSSTLEKDTKKKLENLLKFMKKNSTKAAAKATKALF